MCPALPSLCCAFRWAPGLSEFILKWDWRALCVGAKVGAEQELPSGVGGRCLLWDWLPHSWGSDPGSPPQSMCPAKEKNFASLAIWGKGGARSQALAWETSLGPLLFPAPMAHCQESW